MRTKLWMLQQLLEGVVLLYSLCREAWVTV